MCRDDLTSMFTLPMVVKRAICHCIITDALPVGNLASRKPTWQTGIGWDGQSDRAVDGNANNQWSASTCTHTDLRQSPYWAVDLGQAYTVTGVSITNRQDCCCK